MWWSGVNILFLFAIATAYKSFDGYTLYQVTPTTAEQVKLLTEAFIDEYDIWRDFGIGAQSEILVAPEQAQHFLSTVKDAGLSARPKLRDVGAVVSRQMDEIWARKQDDEKPISSDIPLDRYHELEDIHQWMVDFANDHPELVSLHQATTSYEGRPVLYLQIQSSVGEAKPIYWMDGGIHAREWIAPSVMIYFATYLVDGYGVDDDVTAIIDAMDFYIMPVFNVDGYKYTWTDNRMWRKTRSPNEGSSCNGTDPNRNWDVEWNTVGVSQNPCSDQYPGDSAFSEVEVRDVAALIDELDDGQGIIVYFAYHSFGQMFMTPWGYTDAESVDFAEQIELCDIANEALFDVHGVVYRCDSLNNLVGDSSGSSVDYTYDILHIKWSYGSELRDTGEYGFLLPEDQIIPTCEENWAALLEFAKGVMEPQ